MRDHRQNESNIVIEAPARSRCSQEIDDPLDGGIGAGIGGFEAGVRPMLRVRPVMEAAVGERPAQALVEEAGEAIGDRQEGGAYGVEMIEPLAQAKVVEVVGDQLVAQEGRDLLVRACRACGD